MRVNLKVLLLIESLLEIKEIRRERPIYVRLNFGAVQFQITNALAAS